ncbi:S1C family serine protease [Nocardiopsis aegyptia]|uniref:Putative serine protease PepD n=1 Tax=Nocardiopsis aegyptia TaxID=220378 RepID=A0A7Z0JA20_9ACTN|nr:trypsin-like peptidase domain-containing protein [Nocardiopsis aegyptia]NYJ34322.1 putative serine protease PepD [Nocardiopsis aegyptia]
MNPNEPNEDVAPETGEPTPHEGPSSENRVDDPSDGRTPRFSPPSGPHWATGPEQSQGAAYTYAAPDASGEASGRGPGATEAPAAAQPSEPFSQHPSTSVPPHGGYTNPSQTAAFASGGYGGYPGHGGHPGHPGQPGHPHQGGHPGQGGPGGFGGYGGQQPPGGTPPEHPHHGGGMPPGSQPPPARKRGSGRVVAIAAATALVTSLIVGPATALGTAYLLPGGGLGAPSSSLDGEQGGTPTEGEVGEVADAVLPSVVSIQTADGSGSGVILSSDGQILTNAHVVASARNGELQVLFNDGSTARAEVLGSDTVSDIAVIQAEGRTDLTPAVLGDSDQIGVGGDVVAIGSPLGLQGTVTTGVVSALNRPVNTGATESGNGFTSTVINAIQTDAAINPGNSGGPLVNMNGEVIGINTAIAGISQESGSVGLGFAIPINQARPIAEQLIETGSASYPAIEATISANPQGGATIVDVTEGGAAEEAGLEPEDVVVSVDGEQIGSPDQLIATIRAHQAGDQITLGVRKGGSGSPEDVTVTLGEQSSTSVEQGEESEGN